MASCGHVDLQIEKPAPRRDVAETDLRSEEGEGRRGRGTYHFGDRQLILLSIR